MSFKIEIGYARDNKSCCHSTTNQKINHFQRTLHLFVTKYLYKYLMFFFLLFLLCMPMLFVTNVCWSNGRTNKKRFHCLSYAINTHQFTYFVLKIDCTKSIFRMFFSASNTMDHKLVTKIAYISASKINQKNQLHLKI